MAEELVGLTEDCLAAAAEARVVFGSVAGVFWGEDVGFEADGCDSSGVEGWSNDRFFHSL